MSRIRKNHDERLTEILDAAEKLFATKSYDLTTVNDILEVVGIGKGTFYHYFKSKEEVMEAVLDRLTALIVEKIVIVADDSTLSAHDKMKQMLLYLNIDDEDNRTIIEELNNPSNAKMHEKSMYKINETVSPILAKVVEEGIAEGVYQTDYPLETIEGLIILSHYMVDTAMPLLDFDRIVSRARALVRMIELSLGAQAGSFAFLLEGFDNQN
ncbi:TetR/AcrR family transcriptional regulator [Lactococcus raffinolactis]|uniref:TetR/AcrR family transcriptional regulator n=1 Tax=Pseudolactococcus raffinolactis TaxID=1366 RepID=UPI001108D310|nr:TetR/AcrR family transcriptional regulator [Lactococcus raffinolactis]TLQ15748.1 TetR/AcrR family transcriptional regulator [Lactococcus raffinolactis]